MIDADGNIDLGFSFMAPAIMASLGAILLASGLADRGFLETVRSGSVELVAALEGFDGEEAMLADGARIHPDGVIAATGYRSGLEGLVGHLGVLAPSGEPATLGTDADPAASGLYFNGYWLPLSGELSGIRRDARRIARAIAAGGGLRTG